MEFCPTCGNMLLVEQCCPGREARLFCQTCPYVYNITRKVRAPFITKCKSRLLGDCSATGCVSATGYPPSACEAQGVPHCDTHCQSASRMPGQALLSPCLLSHRCDAPHIPSCSTPSAIALSLAVRRYRGVRWSCRRRWMTCWEESTRGRTSTRQRVTRGLGCFLIALCRGTTHVAVSQQRR